MANIINSIISGGGGTYSPFGKNATLYDEYNTSFKLSDLFATFPTSTSETAQRTIEKEDISIDWDLNSKTLICVMSGFIQYLFVSNTSLVAKMPIMNGIRYISNVVGKGCKSSPNSPFATYNNFLSENINAYNFVARFVNYYPKTEFFYYTNNSLTITPYASQYGLKILSTDANNPTIENSVLKGVVKVPELRTQCNNTYCAGTVVPSIDLDATKIYITRKMYLVDKDTSLVNPSFENTSLLEFRPLFDETKVPT